MRAVKLAVVAAVLLGCPKKEEPKPEPPKVEAPKVEAPKVEQAEVEFFGVLDASKVPAAKRRIIYVSKEPCVPAPAEPTLLGTHEPPSIGPPNWFHEIFTPQGTVGHVCAVALDENGQVIGEAAHAKNPLTFSGQGEVMFHGVDLALTPVSARAAPKGL